MNTPIGSPERLMGEAVAAGDSVPLSQQEFHPLFEEAVTRWAVALGEATAVQRLREVRVEVLDLPGTTLGLASGAVIYLDANGAGHGWFLDQSPWDDSEFTPGRIDSSAAGRVDLLTVMSHELGHILGLDDDSATDPFTGNVMAAVLPLGVRRIHLQGLVSHPPAPAHAEGLMVEGLPRGPRIAMILTAVPVFGSSFAPAAPLPSERSDRTLERAAPGMAEPPKPPAEVVAAAAPALFEPRAVLDDRKELDLVFVELTGNSPFDRDWWPVL
jgi:hypothetical protein